MKHYTTFKAALFHPCGAFVTDFEGTLTPEQVWAKIEEKTAPYENYPIPFVLTENGVIKDTLEEFDKLKGRRVETAQKLLQGVWAIHGRDISASLKNGLPIYEFY